MTQTTDKVSNLVHTTGTIIGGEATTAGFSGGNARKCFSGAMNHLAVWERALSFEEVNHAMGFPQHVFKIGVFNWNNNDMRVESAVDADYTLGPPWHDMPRAVTQWAGNEIARIHFTLTADEADLDYIFHLRTSGTQSAQSADVSVYVNGQDLGTQTTGPNQDYFWNVYDDVLASGANNLEIRYEAGPSSWLSFDWMELAGSWMVGTDNGNPGEFIRENSAVDDFFVFNPNLKACERANTAGDPDINLHFELSDELAAGYHFVYDTRVVQQGGTPSTHPFDILVNGTLMRSLPAQTNGTVVSQGFGSANLVGGDNYITVRFQDTGGWAQYDYHRVRITAVPEGGTVFIIR